MGKRWTSQDHDFLRKEYPRMGSDYCAKKLGRTKSSIIAQASVLRIKKERSKNHPELECKNILNSHNQGVELDELSNKYKVPKYLITDYLKKLKDQGVFVRHSASTGYQEISGHYWINLRRAIIKMGYKFSITLEEAWNLFLKQDRKCAILGIPIKLHPTAAQFRLHQTASLRIFA